jgi:translation initiation factor IF-2
VKQQLQTEGLTPEDWGGETICCEVSAETGDGIEHLLEMILLQAEMLELKANPSRKASGFVIEAQLEAGMGPTASLLVKRGTLKTGDTVLCGPHWGRIKALINDRGEKVKAAGPSMAAKCLGLSGVPEAGASFVAYANDKLARSLAGEAESAEQEKRISVPKKVSLDNFYDHFDAAEALELKMILKADTQGSLEAIQHTLDGIKSDKVSLKLILTGIGNITTNDVLLASASNAVVVGFNVAKETGVSRVAKEEKVDVNLHSIIYELSDEIREAMTGMLAPETVETVIGHARVKEVFSISKIGKIAGCEATDGKITSKARARVMRGDDLIYEGAIATLRRFQNDASEVSQGQECGIRLANFENFDQGDIMEFFETTRVAQSL